MRPAGRSARDQYLSCVLLERNVLGVHNVLGVDVRRSGPANWWRKCCCAERACARSALARAADRLGSLSLPPAPAQVCSSVIWWYFTEPQELVLPCLASVHEVTLDLRFYMFWIFLGDADQRCCSQVGPLRVCA